MRTSWKPIVNRSKALRRAMTLPEVLLWQALRARPAGHKFRHQHAAGPYVLDFYCVRSALCIEVDGKGHEMGANPRRDARRDAWLAGRGIETLRVPAADVLIGVERVVALIEERCASRDPRNPPLDFEGRGTMRSMVEGQPALKDAPPPAFGRSPSPANAGEDKGNS